MNARRTLSTLLCALALGGSAGAQQPGDAVHRAMRDELARTMHDLMLAKFDRPYYVAYRVVELRSVDASATDGALIDSHDARRRWLDVDLRVGDYAFDNTNYFGGMSGGMIMIGRGGGGMMLMDEGGLPLDDDYLAIRRAIWLATDGSYKRAVSMIAAKRAALTNRVRTDTLPDFSRETAAQTTDERPLAIVPRAAAEALVRELSAMPELARLDGSTVRLSSGWVRTSYVNSEGTTMETARPLTTLFVSLDARASDGTHVGGAVQLYADSLGAIDRGAVAARIRAAASRVDSLRTAPVLERYAGPVLFAGEAAGELVAERLAPALVAHRRAGGDPRMQAMLERFSGQNDALADEVGSRVAPDSLTVFDDPTVRSAGGVPLFGGYVADDQGVPASRHVLVHDGILQGFLNGRTPAEGSPRSTGNERGGEVAPSNLFVESAGGVSERELEARLIALVQKRKLPYGIIVRALGAAVELDDDPSIFFASMGGPAEAPRPVTAAYRVYPDGREELVRGARLAPVPVRAFRDIVAASSTPTVHHALPTTSPFMAFALFAGGQSASASGLSSYVVPSLLFEDLSFAKSVPPTARPPLSPPPSRDAGSR